MSKTLSTLYNQVGDPPELFEKYPVISTFLDGILDNFVQIREVEGVLHILVIPPDILVMESEKTSMSSAHLLNSALHTPLHTSQK